MFVSAEIIAVVLSAVGIVVTLGASMFVGFAWCVRRTDAVERRLNDRIDAVGHETTEVKIAVARLEGPVPRLLTRAR
ncbi:hypothetical protein [Microbacterium sp. CR_7]|uniref:hypothetical protein n=1 Tax=Microbacterium sp. CR_7 TaxID=3055792 RepID=UPI0035C10D9F